ncbi:MAG: hypothetical protein U9Q07_15815 [Planctomycetota bacterium]|nr:hypothetical protein [Planctomycetota bacterium]
MARAIPIPINANRDEAATQSMCLLYNAVFSPSSVIRCVWFGFRRGSTFEDDSRQRNRDPNAAGDDE